MDAKGDGELMQRRMMMNAAAAGLAGALAGMAVEAAPAGAATPALSYGIIPPST